VRYFDFAAARRCVYFFFLAPPRAFVTLKLAMCSAVMAQAISKPSTPQA